ncbi:MoaF-related domain-containing protein [Dyadobacter frigoris]|uniref:MoaF-like domain-containing protein n=1 Tax=Dyadobacter frigoris TaxID=2576211 RepID=A0A4V6BKN7_9BACT|nr:hypothetical protein [Dyadobacter frigoris]TKT88043.1 hypothetical protein FDK13_28505 [Dyadobacter frigoris]GLU52944.1 hypothetical protein Dfri01_24050 [Dyadobacter frigoris]
MLKTNFEYQNMEIIGKKFEVDFGAKAVLDIESQTALTFHITEKNGIKVDESETVEIIITQIRSKLFILTWKEISGNTVTQIQDHKNQIVYMNWTLPNGDFIHAKGTIKPVN